MMFSGMPYVDTSPDLGGQNVILKTFEIAIRHNRQTTRTELRVFSRWTYLHLRLQIYGVHVEESALGVWGRRPQKLEY